MQKPWLTFKHQPEHENAFIAIGSITLDIHVHNILIKFTSTINQILVVTWDFAYVD